jgi:hypothetical protein
MLDSYLSGVFLIGVAILTSVAGLVVVRRVLHTRNLISSHDVGGYLLSVVGTMYAVILGLIVVDAMGRFQEARQATEHEANALANIALLAKQFPRDRRVRTEALVLAYIDRVVEDEWPIMDQGRHAPAARRAAFDLIDGVSAFEPRTEKEQALYDAQLGALCEFWKCRRDRMNVAEHGIPPLEWVVLIVGGVLTISFTYFFKLEHLKIQIIMTAMVATIIALCLFLVLMFGYPYSGELKIDPAGFKVVQAFIAYPAGRHSPPSAPGPSPSLHP